MQYVILGLNIATLLVLGLVIYETRKQRVNLKTMLDLLGEFNGIIQAEALSRALSGIVPQIRAETPPAPAAAIAAMPLGAMHDSMMAGVAQDDIPEGYAALLQLLSRLTRQLTS